MARLYLWLELDGSSCLGRVAHSRAARGCETVTARFVRLDPSHEQ